MNVFILKNSFSFIDFLQQNRIPLNINRKPLCLMHLFVYPAKKFPSILLDFFCELWNCFEQISDKSMIGHLENWRFWIFINGNNGFGIFHSGQMLDGPRDTNSDV